MRLTLAALLAVCLLSGLATEADAKPKRHVKHMKRAPAYEGKRARAYPNATERQRSNSLAFDNGDYYESDFNAHAFGSRSWWLLQQNRGGRR